MSDFYYATNIVNNNNANFSSNILNYLSEKNDFSNYKNLFRSIDLNIENINKFSNDLKNELIDLIDQLYEPVEKYFNKYLKGIKETNERLENHNLLLNLNDNVEYTYHLNKFNNMISNIDYSISSYIRELEKQFDKTISFELEEENNIKGL